LTGQEKALTRSGTSQKSEISLYTGSGSMQRFYIDWARIAALRIQYFLQYSLRFPEPIWSTLIDDVQRTLINSWIFWSALHYSDRVNSELSDFLGKATPISPIQICYGVILYLLEVGYLYAEATLGFRRRESMRG